MDIYDEAIAYLTEHPDQIPNAYTFGEEFMGGALFQWATKDGRCDFAKQPNDKYFGDIVQIKRDNRFIGATDEITSVVRLDPRIPGSLAEITVEHLPVFATWQRFLDKKLLRKKTWQLVSNATVVQEDKDEEPEEDAEEVGDGTGIEHTESTEGDAETLTPYEKLMALCKPKSSE